MKQINSIHIKNFRGIKDLAIDNLKPITIFLGENSVGKSTVLESLFLVTGPNNPSMPLKISSMRAHSGVSLDTVSYIYHDADYNNVPSFSTVLDNGKEIRIMSFSPKFTIDETIVDDHLNTLGNKIVPLTGVDCIFEIKTEESLFSGISTLERNKEGKLEPYPDANYEEKVESMLLSPYYNVAESLLAEYSELVKTGLKNLVLDAIRKFDDRITGIEATNDGLFLGYQHLSTMVPLSMAGDGVQKYLSIAIRALRPSLGIIIIDEIENGLHFTAHQKLWKFIFQSAKDLGKQFFISTHNKETLKCLSSYIDSLSESTELLSVITLSREDTGIVPYYLSGEGLSGAIENNVEIRK